MSSCRWLFGAVLCLSLLVTGFVDPARAEFSVGQGEIETATRQASARLNDGFSSFHLMMAELDRKNADLAVRYQGVALTQIQEAADLYEKAATRADDHVIKVFAQTAQERGDLEYFYTHAGSYGIDVKAPISQRGLVSASRA